MKVLVACEFSGTVRDAFTRAGHIAWSCDMLPTEKPGLHYQGDVRDILGDGWDMMICHPLRMRGPRLPARAQDCPAEFSAGPDRLCADGGNAMKHKETKYIEAVERNLGNAERLRLSKYANKRLSAAKQMLGVRRSDGTYDHRIIALRECTQQ